MSLEQDYKNLPDYELENIRERLTPGSPEHKLALKEIFRRQKIKEQQVNKTQKSIKNLTVIILIFTFFLGC